MTEREKRNELMKERIRKDAEAHCQFIDLMEEEMKYYEHLSDRLAREIDANEKVAATA
jgi:low affinity Fe/Cu permease